MYCIMSNYRVSTDFATSTLQRDIVQFSEVGRSFINDTKVSPCHCIKIIDGKQPIDIMWMKSKGESVLNHFVPIVPGSCKSRS